jgi:translocation and assembly module TamA
MNFEINKWVAALSVLVFACMAVFADSPMAEYRAAIKGADDGKMERAIEESALTFKLAGRPPATVGQLRRRVDKDLPMIGKVLESRGYYDGRVTAEIDTGREPFRVTFLVSPGERYRFRNVDLQFVGATDSFFRKIRPAVRKGRHVSATIIFDEQQRIIALMQQNGYPFPRLESRKVVVDREDRAVDVSLVFDPGLAAVYGDFEVVGLETLDSKYIQRQLPWKSGERYDAKVVSDFENKLLATGLFGTARVEPLAPQDGSNSIPVQITVTERSLRTIRVGVGYSDVGPNGKVIWEHRNLFGSGERFRTELAYSPIEYTAGAMLERPGFFRANQSLILDVDATRELPDAYDADKLTTSAIVKREFTRHVTAGTGLRYKYSKVEQLLMVEKYSHIILPVLFQFDNRNDKLNPVKGSQFFAQTSFYEDMNGSESFLKTEVEGRLYQMFWKRPRLSGALRVTLGSVNGASVENIPADERFYAGGGGSIRGYEYQAVGPQVDGTPVGGSQLLEFSTELRLQPGKKLGYAAFVDGGTVYNDLEQDADRTVHYGAGLGLRWFTGIGPLRADVAYPLNPSENQVERVQFYISLGQAF